MFWPTFIVIIFIDTVIFKKHLNNLENHNFRPGEQG